MPKGPQGQKRPADAIGAAIRVARIATSEEAENRATNAEAKAKAGKKGGSAHAAALSEDQRSQIAHVAASARR